MRTRSALIILFSLACLTAVGCAPVKHWQTGWDYWPTNKTYLVTGRVQNFNHQPVAGCKVILVRRLMLTGAEGDACSITKGLGTVPLEGYYPASDKAHETDGVNLPASRIKAEYVVAVTTQTGDYSFNFEPWSAYDVWLYFDATGKGYQPQYIQLNPYLRSITGRGPGRSPVMLNVVLEPKLH